MKAHREPTASVMAVRTAVVLFLFVVVFTGFLSGAYLWTRPALEKSATEEKMKLIDEILPRSAYDNRLLADTLTLPPTPELGLEEESTVYRARQAGVPVALVFEAQARDGYAGRIRLIIALQADGRVAGVRVTQHRETPGLGDYIEVKKDKNKARPWITQFEGRSLSEIPAARWKVKKDGGEISYYAGATITPRAVSGAIYRAAAYASRHLDQLFAEEKTR